MKLNFQNVIFSVLGLFFLAFLAMSFLPGQGDVKGGRLWQKVENLSEEAVAASTTKNHTYPDLTDLRGEPDVSIHLETTQASGTSGGTMYVEVSNDLGTSPLYSTYASWTWTGSADDTIINISDFKNYRLRVRAVTNGTTQTTNQFVNYALSDDDR